MTDETKTRILLEIAAERLGIETLETRNSDSLDFHDLSVWRIRAALERAFDTGRAAAQTATYGAAFS